MNFSAPTRYRLAGWSLLAMGGLAVLHAELEWVPAWPAGACGWITAALLWGRVGRTHRLLVGIITAIGSLALAIAWWRSGALPPAQAISQNHTLLTMIVLLQLDISVFSESGSAWTLGAPRR